MKSFCTAKAFISFCLLYSKSQMLSLLEKKIRNKHDVIQSSCYFLYEQTETVEEPIEDEEEEAKPDKDEEDDEEAEVEEEKEDKPKTRSVTKTNWDWELINDTKPIWTRK